MTTPEGDIKAYLVERIKALGGDVRFVKWLGRNNAPDCRVMFPDGEIISRVYDRAYLLRNCWVETKAPKKGPRPAQAREFERMREYGETVFVLSSKDEIDRAFPL